MRVVLEVVSGPAAGQKAALGPGQELRVGRTEWADFAVPGDGHMSAEHFAVWTDNVACYVKDLGSSNGTRLNGEPIDQPAVVRNGDQIDAGQTRFVIRTEGDAPDRAEVPASEPAVRAVAASASGEVVAGGPSGEASYTVEQCDSGLTLCRGNVDQIGPAELAGLLSQVHPLFLIADFNNLGMPKPEDLQQPDYLFDWLSPDVAETVSPVVLSQDDTAAWPTLVEEGWGNDAVVCLFSDRQKPALLEHLRRSTRVKKKREDPGGGMLGYCWPSVLALLLAHNRPEFVRRLLSGIEAVLVEFPDLPETWQVFGESRIADVLEQVGLVRKKEAEGS